MYDTFKSHQFILELARQNQAEYIEALYSHRHHEHRVVPTPFLNVHRILAQPKEKPDGEEVASIVSTQNKIIEAHCSIPCCQLCDISGRNEP